MSGWDAFFTLMLKALPDDIGEVEPFFEGNLKLAILSGEYTVWVLKDMKSLTEEKLEALLVVRVINDPLCGVKVLDLYVLTLMDRTGFTTFKAGFELLKRLAKTLGCVLVTATTDQLKVKELFEQLGGKALWSLSVEV